MAESVEAIKAARRQREGAQEHPRLIWWREARFGMFIHWGLYALTGGFWNGQKVGDTSEWMMRHGRIPLVEYEQLASRFNPVRFDAAEWVALAKEAGQKYMVITAKHHDGFCMHHTQYTNYNIVDATPFGRDPLKELAEECAKQGMRLGFYYSQGLDWHHPDGLGNDWDYDASKQDFERYLYHYVAPQLRELLTNYGPVALIWFDWSGLKLEQSQMLLNLIHGLQPDCLVNGRIGNALGDYAGAGDNAIPNARVAADWETPGTMNRTWGFTADDQDWKPVNVLIRKLVDVVSKGGNYLLNVGPTAEGVIPEPSVTRLRAMGEWLRVNGESIYGTGPGPIQGQSWCRTTAKAGYTYLHVFDWPEDGILNISQMGIPVQRAYLLADPSRHELPLIQSDQGTLIRLSAIAPDPVDTVVVLTRPACASKG